MGKGARWLANRGVRSVVEFCGIIPSPVIGISELNLLISMASAGRSPFRYKS